MNVAAKIRMLRKEKGITQKGLALLSGLAEITIRQYEAAKYVPKLEQLRKIAKALNVRVEELYETDDYDTEHQLLKINSWMEDAGLSLNQDEDDKKFDNFQICDEETGTVKVMQKQDLIELIEGVIKEAEDIKQKFIVDKIKVLFYIK